MEKIFLKTYFCKTIDNYEFLGLNKALRMKSTEVLEKVKENCIRGRGGAGFPAGIKWDFVAAEKSEIKFVVCNGDEGEPGTFKDRFLLENLPFKVIEGIIIAGYAVDARYGYIYIRGEYEKAIKSIRESIHKMTERKLLGKSILGSSFGFEDENLIVLDVINYFDYGDLLQIINKNRDITITKNNIVFIAVTSFFYFEFYNTPIIACALELYAHYSVTFCFNIVIQIIKSFF